ncbi:hypothetical protein C8P63_10460 [Melghirimyces profundicolus]|uniref:Uncharacterized protein n=1 Tax=Melghirimyces profundicolus TaxID=1242148 RepID=A0A2T6C4G2_9BACL|nr:hypothetical protein [Melghirimyces profundicolus]PTX63216.1 hypothetical protein C8P63_10460 [Melghirimyces profundicolus]
MKKSINRLILSIMTLIALGGGIFFGLKETETNPVKISSNQPEYSDPGRG